MANALDRVKAAEAKYTAMAGDCRKARVHPQEFQGHRGPVLCGHARVAQGNQKGPGVRPALGFRGVCVDGRDCGRGRRHLREFFTGGCRANPRCSGGLVGKLM